MCSVLLSADKARRRTSDRARNHWSRLIVALGLVASTLMVTVAQAAPAIQVTHAADDGSEGSLRWAIEKANKDAGPDTVVFAPSVNTTPIVISPTASPIIITEALVIQGNGVGNTIISGGGKTRILASIADLTLKDITLKNGYDFEVIGLGAALLAIPNPDSTAPPPISITLDNVLVSDHQAREVGGVALLSFSSSPSTLSIRNSTFQGNEAENTDPQWGNASAVFTLGANLTIEKSVIRDNRGGPTVLAWYAPALRIDQSVLSGNTVSSEFDNLHHCSAVVCGFGIVPVEAEPASMGTAAITRSLFADNRALDNIVVLEEFGTTQVVNNTMTANTITDPSWVSGMLSITGGRDDRASNTLVSFNTIHANSYNSTDSWPPLTGMVFFDHPQLSTWTVSSNIVDDSLLKADGLQSLLTMLDRNLLQNIEADWAGTPPGQNMYWSDARLGSLATNGATMVGATGHQAAALSFMPPPGSPAIDAGDAARSPDTDQPGTARPTDLGPEIGAVEAPSSVLPAPVSHLPAVTGVTVNVGSMSQSASFEDGSDTVTLTFDVSSLLRAGQDLSLTIKAIPTLLADACGCNANTLIRSLGAGPTPIPTLSQFALVLLGGLMLLVALRGGAGKRGIKLLPTVGLGVALIQPTGDLRAASTNALLDMQVSLSGTTLTVTVKRNMACVTDLAPVLPSPVVMQTKWWVDEWPQPVVLPPATDPENDTLTYSVSGIPDDWSFDAATRTLTGPRADSCHDDRYEAPPVDDRTSIVQFQYSAAGSCKAVTVSMTCQFGSGGGS